MACLGKSYRLASSLLVVFFLLSSILLSVLPTKINAQSNNVASIDDLNVKISIYPNISFGGWIYLNFTSKLYSGLLDFILGFNTDVATPERADLYSPHDVNQSQTYKVPDYYFNNLTFFKYNYTFTSQNTQYLFKGTFWLWSQFNGTWTLDYCHSYKYIVKATKTAYWDEMTRVDWVKLTQAKLDWKVITQSYLGMNKWWFFQRDVVAGRQYSIRIWLDVVPEVRPTSETKEYFFAVKPSSESLVQAVVKGHLYILDPWFNPSWNYREAITIDHTKISADLTNFPVMVYLNSSRIDWTNVEDDLDDIRFTDALNTTLLKYEIESYNTNINATLWVKIPSVSSSVDTVFYMYYGNVAATSGQDAENVWDSNFKMVQHMKDATTSTTLDSTSNNNDGTKKNANEPIETYLGKFGMGELFDGLNDYVALSVVSGSVFTWSVWVNIEDVNHVSNSQSMVTIAGANYMLFDVIGSLTQLDMWSSDGLSADTLGVNGLAKGVWYNIVFVRQANNTVNGYMAYLGGVQKGQSNTGLWLSSNVHRIGGRVSADQFFHGAIDEVRISNVNRSLSWIGAEYYSGIDSLLTYGVEEEALFLTVYFYTGISNVYLNETSVANGSSTLYSLNDVVNITSAASSGFVFDRYLWSLTNTFNHTHSNPFYLTISHSQTVHAQALAIELPANSSILLILLIPIVAILALFIFKRKR